MATSHTKSTHTSNPNLKYNKMDSMNIHLYLIHDIKHFNMFDSTHSMNKNQMYKNNHAHSTLIHKECYYKFDITIHSLALYTTYFIKNKALLYYSIFSNIPLFQNCKAQIISMEFYL